MTPFAAKLAAEIARDGPKSLSQVMVRALHDPEHGFYSTAQPFGPEGHFLTAPEVSQMFGELLGLWAVACWQQMGEPDPFDLIELGPGQGTMMADMLRAVRLEPRFLAAARLTLLEASPRLMAVQRARLAGVAVPTHVQSLNRLPTDRPFLMVGNEFLDCLGIQQFVRDPDGWRELKVGASAEGALSLGRESGPPLPPDTPLMQGWEGGDPSVGTLVEVSPATDAVVASLAARLSTQPGYILLLDYGPATSEPGSSLQAIRAHQKVDPLTTLGEADLTHHVDFARVLARARTSDGIATAGPLPQAQFLHALGIDLRAKALMAKSPERAEVVARQYSRLMNPEQMGALFKTICLYGRDLPPPPGFP